MRWLWALALSACAGPRSVGAAYQDQGRRALALAYYERAFHADGDNNGLADLIHATSKNLLATLQREETSRADTGDAEGALARAMAQIDVAETSTRAGRPMDSTALYERAAALRKQAAEKRLRALDEGEVGRAMSAKSEVGLFERTVAWIEDDPELAHRYATLREKALKRVRLGACASDQCAAVLAGAGEQITRSRGALVSVVTGDDAQLELTVELSEQHATEPFHQQRSGTAERKVAKRNRFNEVEKNAEGKTIEEAVKASYTVYASRSWSKGRAKLVLTDLRKQQTVWSEAIEANAENANEYIEWQGDERALGDDLQRYGTNRMPPKTTETLGRDVMLLLGKSAGSRVLSALEKL